jgi:hypothetical protein
VHSAGPAIVAAVATMVGTDECGNPQNTSASVPTEAESGVGAAAELQTPFTLWPPPSTTPEGDHAWPGGIQPRTEWSNLSLPDLDDMSMNYVVLYMEHYKVDLLWSFVSDSFFILGGVSYILLTGWDCVLKWRQDETTQKLNQLYIALDVFAPTVYLVNSIVDIYWAEYIRLQLRDKRGLTKIWEDFRLQLRGISFSSTSVASDDDVDDAPSQQNTCEWWYRIRKHAAHRRTLAAAFTFGIAASLGVMAAVLRNWFVPSIADAAGLDPWVYRIDGILDQWTDHVYIVSAIISMTGKRHRPWFAPSDPSFTSWWSDSERLVDLGDLLFLIGSLMDASLSDFHLDHLVLFPVLSSLLWMIDGCLYMRSDFLKAAKLDEAEFSFFGPSKRIDTRPVSIVV